MLLLVLRLTLWSLSFHRVCSGVVRVIIRMCRLMVVRKCSALRMRFAMLLLVWILIIRFSGLLIRPVLRSFAALRLIRLLILYRW